MKVIIFSLKVEKCMYAFTINEEYANIFRNQRNMSLFNENSITMNKYEFMVFSSRMSRFQLCKDYLDDGENDIEIIASIKETSELSETCEYFRRTYETITKNIDSYNIKKKYLKPIIKLTQSIIKSIDNHPTLNINTFTLFYYLFRNTFSEYELPDSKKLNFLISYEE